MVHIFDNFVRERENNYKNNISLKIVKDERMKSRREGKMYLRPIRIEPISSYLNLRNFCIFRYKNIV